MARSTLLPSTLPLFPLPRPQVLFPFLQVSIALSTSHLSHLLETFSSLSSSREHTETHKDDRSEAIFSENKHSKKDPKMVSSFTPSSPSGQATRVVAAIPVADHDRRVGRWACAARLKQIEKGKDEDEWIVTFEGLTRIYLPRQLPPVLSILPPLPLTQTPYSFPLPSPSTPPSLLPIATHFLPSQLHARFAQLPPSIQSDLLATILDFIWDTRVELLGTPRVEERCDRVREILLRVISSRRVTSSGNEEKGDSAGPTTQSQALIQKSRAPSTPTPLNIPEDLQPLQTLLSQRASELSPAALQAASRELSRLAKIPPQAAEYGVGRTYIEWILALPWKRVSGGETAAKLDLEAARARLEEEHEGLKEVKRRIIEYLAVYRLKRALWEEKKGKEKRVAESGNGELSKMTAIAEKDTEKYHPGLAADVGHRPNSNSPSPSPALIEDAPSDDVFRDKAPILLLVGPPGVGKTSIARSLAGAMGRKFHRISLGGVRDEAEIRGHRRTYVGALPGLFVQGLRKVGVSNPVVLLDELDKVGSSNYHGDPSAALLETLDPAQNWAFHDHYLGDVPIDLSQVTFIATANTLDTISPPLLDRCEVIECSGYLTDEKITIARRFIVPKQIAENGLPAQSVKMDDEVLRKLVDDYTREAGVRGLEREIAKLCRSKAVEYSIARQETGGKNYEKDVRVEDVERVLGMAKFEQEVKEELNRPGVVTGLAYRGSGNGGILLIECVLLPSGKGRLILTGSLGEVIKESAELALAWVKAHSTSLSLVEPLQHKDVHIHLPAGAVKKDGPSAGLAIIVALVSLLTDRAVSPSFAFTGEITLRGTVTAVGGIREKVLGAHRAGITRVFMPASNMKDLVDVPDSAKKSIKATFVKDVSSVLREVWGDSVYDPSAGREARL